MAVEVLDEKGSGCCIILEITSHLLCQLCQYVLSDVRTYRGPWVDWSAARDPHSRYQVHGPLRQWRPAHQFDPGMHVKSVFTVSLCVARLHGRKNLRAVSVSYLRSPSVLTEEGKVRAFKIQHKQGYCASTDVLTSLNCLMVTCLEFCPMSPWRTWVFRDPKQLEVIKLSHSAFVLVKIMV